MTRLRYNTQLCTELILCMHRDRTLHTQIPPRLIPQESLEFDYSDFYKHTLYESRHSIHQEKWRERARRRVHKIKDGTVCVMLRKTDCSLGWETLNTFVSIIKYTAHPICLYEKYYVWQLCICEGKSPTCVDLEHTAIHTDLSPWFSYGYYGAKGNSSQKKSFLRSEVDCGNIKIMMCQVKFLMLWTVSIKLRLWSLFKRVKHLRQWNDDTASVRWVDQRKPHVYPHTDVLLLN